MSNYQIIDFNAATSWSETDYMLVQSAAGVTKKITKAVMEILPLSMPYLDGNGTLTLPCYSDTLANNNFVVFAKSHQDTVGNTITLDQEYLGGIVFQGNNGSGFTTGAYIRALQQGAMGTYPATDLYFQTSDGTNAATTKLRIGSDGYTNITGNASGYLLRLVNDGNATTQGGMVIESGTDDDSGTNYKITFRDGDATTVGWISSSGGVVSYTAFTGSHVGKTPASSKKYGTLLHLDKSIKGKNGTGADSERCTMYVCSPTKIAKDKAVFGIYAGENHCEDEGRGLETKGMDTQIYALGDGHILACSQGGNIEIGDYICSSDVEGHGMKQDDDLLHNYTIAKATEAVDWAAIGKTKKLISCTYHAA